MVLAHDLLEDRCTIDVIIAKFSSRRFKMAGRFENLDNILRDWANDKVQKTLAEALNRCEKQKEERLRSFLYRKLLRKNTRTVAVGTKHKIGIGKPRTIALSRI